MDLVGTTFNIMDEIVVDVVVVDSQGNSLTFQATVMDDRFEIPSADLSSLAEGPIVAIATYADPYGNRVSGADNSIIDTLAEGITVQADTDADTPDAVINAIEAVESTLSGTFINVQEGAQVAVTFSGGSHPDLTFTLTAETVDQAGNPVAITDTVEMDTLAAITAEFVDAELPGGVANYLNANEGLNAGFTGTVSEVEEGQEVTVVVIRVWTG